MEPSLRENHTSTPIMYFTPSPATLTTGGQWMAPPPAATAFASMPSAIMPQTGFYWPPTPQFTANVLPLQSDMTSWRRPTSPATAMPLKVVVRSVWAHNLAYEMHLIRSMLGSFPYVAVDTEFPGTVHRPEKPIHALSAQERYALVKANVEELRLIQLGLTLCDAAGRLPDFGTGGAMGFVWEFNFGDFDVSRDRHAPESIALLRSSGLNFERTRADGVDSAVFAAWLRELWWPRGGLTSAAWITFCGAYDLAFLMKLFTGGGRGDCGFSLPDTVEAFTGVVATLFGRNVFDVKEMARHCPEDLRGGLERLAGKIHVRRAVGKAHQAGSDSLLTCEVFLKMRERFFRDGRLPSLAGMLDGMQ